MVGGAVRDALLGREVTDVDIAVAGSAAEVARRIARAAGGHPFELSGDFATWRVVAHDGSWKLDVAELRGQGIEGRPGASRLQRQRDRGPARGR